MKKSGIPGTAEEEVTELERTQIIACQIANMELQSALEEYATLREWQSEESDIVESERPGLLEIIHYYLVERIEQDETQSLDQIRGPIEAFLEALATLQSDGYRLDQEQFDAHKKNIARMYEYLQESMSRDKSESVQELFNSEEISKFCIRIINFITKALEENKPTKKQLRKGIFRSEAIDELENKLWIIHKDLQEAMREKKALKEIAFPDSPSEVKRDKKATPPKFPGAMPSSSDEGAFLKALKSVEGIIEYKTGLYIQNNNPWAAYNLLKLAAKYGLLEAKSNDRIKKEAQDLAESIYILLDGNKRSNFHKLYNFFGFVQ